MNHAVPTGTLLYAEFCERQQGAIIDQMLTAEDRNQIHAIVARHRGEIIESISRRLVASFARPESALDCARALRALLLELRQRLTGRSPIQFRALLLPTPPGAPSAERWAEIALKFSIDLARIPANGIGALEMLLPSFSPLPRPAPRPLPAVPGRGVTLSLLAYEDGGAADESMTRAAAPFAGAGLGLFADLILKVGEESRVLHPPDCPVSIGRSRGCAVVLEGDAVSRLHGRIEFVNDKYYYADDSRNGSYVLTHDGTEVHLVRERILLVGDGVISPGAPMMKQTGQVIRFRCTPVKLSLGDDAVTKPRG